MLYPFCRSLSATLLLLLVVLLGGCNDPSQASFKWVVPEGLAIADVSPDESSAERPEAGPRVAFMSDRDGNFEVYIVDADGSNLRNLTNAYSADVWPLWSPLAAQFMFITDRDASDFHLYRMAADGDGQRRVASNLMARGMPVLSPSEEWIAMTAEIGGVLDVYLVDTTSNAVRNLTASATSQDKLGAWSPDGQQLLVISDRLQRPNVFVMDINGGEEVLLTASPGASSSPTWSPDGTQIAFMTDRDDDIEIYVMDADGSNTVNLTNSPDFDGYPAWSPDGTKIGFISTRDGDLEIYVMNADGSALTNLTNHPGQDAAQGDFVWSPDGRQILFHTDRDDNVEVYIMDADGGNPTNLSNHPSVDMGAIWVK